MTLDELIYRHLELGGRIARDHPNRRDIETMKEADKRIEELRTTQKKLAYLIDRVDFIIEELHADETVPREALFQWSGKVIRKLEAIE